MEIQMIQGWIDEAIIIVNSLINQSLVIIQPLLQRIQEFFIPYLSGYQFDSSWLIGGYLIVILLLIVIQKGVVKASSKVVQKFVESLDEVLYLQAKMLYFNHQSLHDESTNLPLLTYAKRQMLQSSEKNYFSHYEALKKDIQYCEELFQQPIVQPAQREQLGTTFGFLKKMSILDVCLRVILGIGTLGIGLLFVRKIQ